MTDIAPAAPSAGARERTLEVAHEGFRHFAHGLATGEWDGFLSMISDDFEFFFPMGKFQGQHRGKETAREFFAYVSSVFDQGLFATLDRVTANETTAVFEFRDEGLLRGEPYRNRVAVSFDVRDGMIVGYREYFGSDGKSN